MGGCAWGSHAVRGLQCGRWVYIGVYKRSVKTTRMCAGDVHMGE